LFKDLFHDYARKVDCLNELRPRVQPSSLVDCQLVRSIRGRHNNSEGRQRPTSRKSGLNETGLAETGKLSILYRVACGVPKKVAELARVKRPATRPDIRFRMDLHRALVRNNDFFEVLVPKSEEEKDEGTAGGW
jgi:hypothetical protein